MTANRCIQITAVAVGAFWLVLPGPSAAYASERRWHAATLTFDLTEKQSLRLLAAPLGIETSFTPDEPVVFQDLVYPAGRPIDARYAFDSYRLSWYWRFAPRDQWSFRLGATLKVRSAEIGLTGDPGSSVKEDLGLVPLVYAYARYQASDRSALELEADALATFALFHYAVAGVRARF